MNRILDNIIRYVAGICIHCEYFDLIPRNNICQGFCLKYDKEVETTDSCKEWRIRTND